MQLSAMTLLVEFGNR